MTGGLLLLYVSSVFNYSWNEYKVVLPLLKRWHEFLESRFEVHCNELYNTDHNVIHTFYKNIFISTEMPKKSEYVVSMKWKFILCRSIVLHQSNKIILDSQSLIFLSSHNFGSKLKTCNVTGVTNSHSQDCKILKITFLLGEAVASWVNAAAHLQVRVIRFHRVTNLSRYKRLC